MSSIPAVLGFSLLTAVCALHAQSGCGTAHADPGVFICYPNPGEQTADEIVPTAFHISAQVNGSAGRKVSHYVIQIDDRQIYEVRLSVPLPQLSIETNVKSPFASGEHKLRLSVDGIGSAEIKDIQFRSSPELGFCDPFYRIDPRSCLTSNFRSPLEWSAGMQFEQTAGALGNYSGYLALYDHNLMSLELDAADAVAVDPHGNLYEAFHVIAGVEVREYTRVGSLIYDSLIPSCGGGFISVAGIAVGGDGRLWIAGNSKGCKLTTPDVLETNVDESARIHGFLIVVDTKRIASSPPLHAAYLSRVENQISGIRIDQDGSAYVTGSTPSLEFHHDTVVNAGDSPTNARAAEFGFVCSLSPVESRLQWCTLLRGARLSALAVGPGMVHVTGSAISKRFGAESKDLVLVGISGGGKLSYLMHVGGRGVSEGRAISSSANDRWVLVMGMADSADFPPAIDRHRSQLRNIRPFLIAFDSCKNTNIYWDLLDPSIIAASSDAAVQGALDFFAGGFLSPAIHAMTLNIRSEALNGIQPPNCSASRP